jgi:predicted metal-dependent phosphotriesterase family hydrolase
MGKKVTTVLGPVAPEDMGFTDAHNHLWISSLEGLPKQVPALDQYDLILEELDDFKKNGGSSQIDCQPGGAGRDGNRLRDLSLASGVNIVACTGFHLDLYYPEGIQLWQMDAEDAAGYFIDEIESGLMETRGKGQPVYPGFIKAAVRESLEKTPRQLLEAAVEASKMSGFAIEMHTERGAAVEDFLDFLNKMEFELERLIICHIDKRPDVGLHKELAQAGCALEYDTFFRPKYLPEKNVWNLIPEMVNAGFHRSLVLATDLAESELWAKIGGGPGLSGFMDQILKRLETTINDRSIILDLMGANIARFLAVNDKELLQ